MWCPPSLPTALSSCLAVSAPFQLANLVKTSLCFGIDQDAPVSVACNVADENQMIRFRYTNNAGEQIQIAMGSVPRLCLSRREVLGVSFVPLILEDCALQNTNQLWVYDATTGRIKFLSDLLENKCVDDSGTPKLPNRLVYGSCNSQSNNQTFRQQGEHLITPSSEQA